MKLTKITFRLIIIYLVLLFCNCSNNERPVIEYSLNFQVRIPEEYQDKYTYSDFNIKLYENKEDYFNEKNEIFEGKIDSNGKILIENLKDNIYFFDIYSDDNVLSNWIGYTSSISASQSTEVSNDIYINGNNYFIGEWSFLKYRTDVSYDRTNRTKLAIRKDGSITSYENYNGTDFVVKYKITRSFEGQLHLKYIETTPSDYNLYPYQKINNGILVNTEGLYIFKGEITKTISFSDHSNEDIFYTK